MRELVSIFLIGVSLSMDTFSLSLSIGTLAKDKIVKIIPFVVGIFHFFMPILGSMLGFKLVAWFNLASHVLLGLILIFLAFNLAFHYFKDENINIKLNLIGIIFFAISVSIDSFTVGIGLSAITNKNILASVIFSLTSGVFTYLGILIGKYSTRYIGKKANFLGIILLLILGIYHLFN